MARDRGAGDEARLIASVLEAFEEAGGDYESVPELVCRLGADLTGDPWAIRLVDEDGVLRPAGCAAQDPETAADIRRTLGGLQVTYETSFAAELFRSGTPVLFDATVLDQIRPTAQPTMLELAARRGFVGGVLAPLRVRGRVIGVLWWACQHHDGDHDEDDVRFASTVAERCALAIDNARLLRSIEAERNRSVALLAQISDAVCVVDADGTIRQVVPGGVTRVLGWQPHELVGSNVFDLVHRRDHEKALEGFVHAIGPDDLEPIVIRVRHKDGTWRHLRVSAQNLLEDPAVGGVVVTGHDTTEQIRAQELLNAENDILERVATDASLDETLDELCRMIDSRIRGAISSIWLIDEANGELVAAASPNLPGGDLRNRSQGRAGAQYARNLPRDIFVADPETEPLWAAYREEARAAGIRCSWTRSIITASGDALGAVIIYRGDHREPADDERTAIELGARLAAVAVNRSRDADRLAHAATHDLVTDLPNRRLFIDRLQQAVARQRRGARPPSVLFVDLDRFKQVNDRAGHAAGDDVLRLLGGRLERVVRPTDVVARFGGDEFAVLCDETGEDEAMSVAERLLAAICEPVDLYGRRHHLSASIGIASGRGGVSHDALVRRADVAMYRAKAQGAGGIVAFRSGMTERARSDLEHDLRRAIDENEIFVHYQPIADIRLGRWSGVEALARWHHRDSEWVAPTTFVALAEEIGLAVPLGECVLAQVCADAATWAEDPVMRHVLVGVNVSGRQLADPRFLGTVQRQVTGNRIDASRLFVELTETTMMEEFESAREAVFALQSLGLSLAIDDFGTGHSTLARLRQFPAMGLKLDRTFVAEIGDDRRSENIIAAVVQLAHAVGMAVCAEGVETVDQLATVRRLGVDLAQGYLLGRPLPAAELRDHLVTPPPVDALVDEASP